MRRPTFRRSLGLALGRVAARARAVLPTPPPPPPQVELESVRRRLELLVSALHDRPMSIEPTDRPPTGRLRGWLARRRAERTPSIAATDGETILLPSALGGGPEAIAHYRLLALEQAERVVRGTVTHMPTSPLERDLYLVAEGAVVDRALARGGTRAALDAARATALAARPPLEMMPSLERTVERLLQDALAGRGDALPASATPVDSLQWARETAARMQAADASPYVGIPPVPLWGVPRTPPARKSTDDDDGLAMRSGFDAGGSAPRPADAGESGNEPDTAAESDAGDGSTPSGIDEPLPNDAPQSLVAQPMASGDARDAGSASSSLDEIDDDAPPRGVAPGTRPTVTEYPEWDATTQRYRMRAVRVQQWRAAEGDAAWGRDALREHAGLVRRVRERFERLRAQRVRLTNQRDGEELDLAACVRAAVDRRLGHAVDDRLYTSVRPARRGLAIALLVDVSGSTDTPVSGTRQVIDVEKMATLLACEALEALGDSYAVFAFSSRGARRVWMRTVKDFAERHGDAVRRRIAALEPEANTRLGAAVRHATALLARQPAGHRLLLIVSDGRPNDIDHYQDRFAIEDSRQAIAEARGAGVHPFCLTVDREHSDYLARIFGPAGYTIMREPDLLPAALLKGVKAMVE